MPKTYTLVPTASGDAGDHLWDILDGTTLVGHLERRQTGYLATNLATGTTIKRYRMIDALKDAFGTDANFL